MMAVMKKVSGLIFKVLVFFVVVVGLCMAIGIDGFHAIGVVWGDIGFFVAALKYVVVVSLVFYWKEACAWVGLKSGNAAMWQSVKENGRVFIMIFIVVELASYFS